MCKKDEVAVVDLDDDDRQDSIESKQAILDQKISERQARFGRDGDGASAKSSVATKRSTSSGTTTGASPTAPTSEASVPAQTPARTPYAPPPPAVPQASTTSVAV